MSEEQTNAESEKDPQWYRDAIAKANAENAALRDTIKDSMFGGIPGLNPKEGLGRTMVESYEGEMNQTEFLAWAKERYEWEPPSGQPQPEGSPNPAAQEVNGIVSEATGRQEAVMGATGQLDHQTSDLDAQIAEAQAANDLSRVVQLKTLKAVNISR